MTWPFENDTSAVVKRLSNRNVAANRKRNIFTILTIALATALLSAIMLYGFGVPQETKNLNKNTAQIVFHAISEQQGQALYNQEEIDWVGEFATVFVEQVNNTTVNFTYANADMLKSQNMLEGFGVGCDDYIPKPFSIEVLRKKVQAILKRTINGTARIRYKNLEVDTDKCLVLLNGEEVHLTSTEYKLLCYLIENKGRIVTKAMLLEQLWDIDGNFVDENTVRVNIKRLRQKLNDEKQEYIVTVFGMGYTFGE